MSKAIDITDLPEPLVEAIESLVKTYRNKTSSQRRDSEVLPPIGWLKGKWEIPESFFDPLPEELLDLFNGTGEQA
jgi:hypothetical protein